MVRMVWIMVVYQGSPALSHNIQPINVLILFWQRIFLLAVSRDVQPILLSL
jgi:hypothetical protein